eukprot:2876224-Rhodomonas_salina.1
MGGMSDSGAAEESTGKPDAGYTEIRFMDYRRDELPVEKAVALTGQFTYAEAWKAVIIGAISVNGSTASAGQLVRRRDELKFEGSSPSIVPRIRDAMSGNNIGMLLSGKLLPERQEIVYYLLNKPRQVMSTCKVGAGATASEHRRSAPMSGAPAAIYGGDADIYCGKP